MITETVISNYRTGYYRILLSLFLFPWLHKKKNKKEKNKIRIDNNIMCYSTYFKENNTHSRLKVAQPPFLHKTKIGFFN